MHTEIDREIDREIEIEINKQIRINREKRGKQSMRKVKKGEIRTGRQRYMEIESQGVGEIDKK